MEWLNEPASWQDSDGQVTFTADPQTDAWRITHDGGIRDNAHFYYQEVTGDFEMSVQVAGEYATLYDQAGLMVRLDEKTWMKCGIEYYDDMQNVSTVITRDVSDWSITALPDAPATLTIIVKRHGATLTVEYIVADKAVMQRQGYLSDAPTLKVGLMSAAPTGDGFNATFENFIVKNI
ncbi:DUF1349 domain-containing protein [Chloroflexota bacterium]